MYFLLTLIIKITLLQISATERWNNNNHNLLKVYRSIQKCCPFSQYFDDSLQLCVQMINNKSLDFSDLNVYDDDINEVKNYAKYSFDLKYNADFFKISTDIDLLGLKYFLTESGILYLETPNCYKRWNPFPVNKYCLDYKVSSKESDDKPVPHFWIFYDDVDVETPNPTKDYYEAACLIVSCVFLMLVLFVYSTLEYLRNIKGMILMAYVFSLLITFLILATIKVSDYPTPICIVLSCMGYFFFLASFFWMNVMSFNLWKTFRGYVNSRRESGSGQKLKFQRYCAYAWGLPLIMTIGLIVLNQCDMSNLPWFVTPKIAQVGCFIHGVEKFLYLYVPTLFLIICNWVFYLLTACNICSLHRSTAVIGIHYVGNNATYHDNKKMFWVYIHISIVMGLSWIFEIICFFLPCLSVWYVTDVYNALLGPIIFYIFIWKKKILKELMSIYGSKEKPTVFDVKRNYTTEDELYINKDVVMQATKQI